VESNTFYIKLSRAGQARFEPSLPKFKMPAVLDVDDLLRKQKPFVEWSADFSGLKAQHPMEPVGSDGSVQSWERLETPVLED
jgi:hypothetical protein